MIIKVTSYELSIQFCKIHVLFCAIHHILHLTTAMDEWEVYCFAGDLACAKYFWKLVDLENVKTSIEEPVTEDQKLDITKGVENAF